MDEPRLLLEKTVSKAALTDDELTSIFSAMLSGRLSPGYIAAFLSAWRACGETAQLLRIGAQYLRTHAVKPNLASHLRPLCDNCGTGGSGLPKFNISTAAAIVAASCGVKVAKHGNRSVSSRCGSADLLFEAGYPLQQSEAEAVRLLDQTGLTFFFAPNFHPVVANVMPVRKELGIKTIFNLLGPLANPLAPEIQLLGVGHRSYLQPVAEALLHLGVRKALVVHSVDGLDEISPAAATNGLLVEAGCIKPLIIEPDQYAVKASLAGLAGKDARHNLEVLKQVLQGAAIEATEGVVINAGALLWLADAADSMKDGVKLARQKLADGSCEKFFNDWIQLANV